MPGKYFKASLDRLARISTIIFSALLLGVAAINIRVLIGTQMPASAYLLVLLLLSIWLLCFGLAPIGYELTDTTLAVRRRLNRKFIARDAIAEVTLLNRESISWSIRTFGVGGLFGYYGKFANRKLGAMTWYLSRRDRVVLLRLHNGSKIVLSPDDAEAFVAALSS
jgi:hypothetical protein